MKHAPSPTRSDDSPRGNTRFATAPCHGTCGGDELHDTGICVQCRTPTPRGKVWFGHSIKGKRK
jgi:hypothetical protein